MKRYTPTQFKEFSSRSQNSLLSPRTTRNTISESPINISKSNLTRKISHNDNSNPFVLKEKRQKIMVDIDTYTIFIESNSPLRCLTHNCNLSLYCETEQKLLCVKCIYNNTSHRFHKVLPLDNSIDEMKRDINRMERHINRQIDHTISIQHQINTKLNDQKRKSLAFLENLDEKYVQIIKALDKNLLYVKQNVVKYIEQFQHRVYEALNEIIKTRNFYKQYCLFSQKLQQSTLNYATYGHLVSSKALEMDRLNSQIFQNWLSTSQIQNLYHRENKLLQKIFTAFSEPISKNNTKQKRKMTIATEHQ